MIAEEILKKVRRIEIISKKSSKELFAGEYHSAFKGRGMEFSEVREYIDGDDIRFIDWNVSSRMGKLYVKQFVEERELTVILAIDLSASLNFFSQSKSKKEIAAEISAIIAFTASLNHDKVGLLIFTDRVERFIPPKKGKTHILRIIREILQFEPEGKSTSIDTALVYLNKVIKKKAILFLLSDFIDKGFTQSLKIASQKHDFIAIKISDIREKTLPKSGIFILKDHETGEEFFIDFSSKHVRQSFLDDSRENENHLLEIFKKYDVDYITIEHEEEYEKPLFDFFMERRRRFAR
ncbi:MAG: DUF58 domain-containing protein [Candidatus Aminicenantes bacterium]|nr:DUF58 domain-containing protein [Candidatus Aminicenantes bacterium]NIM82976.1 DUF58 domain-containing protein [Candidatus Aminicenantes bacterium]NIN22361.1 DUF58 domain-containing protein [Candidatus Aminicenantes bacterium]NIN46121.1 DUF58 domain-containing protein [Candidatus Aminicenantes bacterium]NIN88957.1 DUF58 domain-containing protein [Candidatus Aminicenantes bacterium]